MRLKKSLLHSTVLLIGITFRCELNAESKSQPFIDYINPVSAICTRVVNGDTLIVDIAGVKERVGLIGVDTPETKPPQYSGKEASMFTANKVEDKKVRLEFDQNQKY